MMLGIPLSQMRTDGGSRLMLVPDHPVSPPTSPYADDPARQIAAAQPQVNLLKSFDAAKHAQLQAMAARLQEARVHQAPLTLLIRLAHEISCVRTSKTGHRSPRSPSSIHGLGGSEGDHAAELSMLSAELRECDEVLAEMQWLQDYGRAAPSAAEAESQQKAEAFARESAALCIQDTWHRWQLAREDAYFREGFMSESSSDTSEAEEQAEEQASPVDEVIAEEIVSAGEEGAHADYLSWTFLEGVEGGGKRLMWVSLDRPAVSIQAAWRGAQMRRRISTELRALSGLKAPQARHSLNMGRLLALSAALIAYLCAVVAAVVAQPRT